jgi:hypothetical protein
MGSHSPTRNSSLPSLNKGMFSVKSAYKVHRNRIQRGNARGGGSTGDGGALGKLNGSKYGN